MSNALISILIIMVITLILWGANFVLSLFYNVKTLGEEFDKVKLKYGLLKITVILVGTLLLAIGIIALLEYIARTGVIIEGITDGISVGAIIIIYGGVCVYYGGQAIITLKGIFTK